MSRDVQESIAQWFEDSGMSNMSPEQVAQIIRKWRPGPEDTVILVVEKQRARGLDVALVHEDGRPSSTFAVLGLDSLNSFRAMMDRLEIEIRDLA